MNYIGTVMELESEIRRLRKANEELMKALKRALLCAEGEDDGYEYVKQMRQALKSSEECK